MTSPSLPYDAPRPEADLRRTRLPRGAYPVPHSKRTSRSPSPNTAWKHSSDSFVIWVLHRITVPGPYNRPHTHSGSHRLWSVLPANDFLARRMAVSEGAIMQLPVYRLRRIPLPRTRVHKGM